MANEITVIERAKTALSSSDREDAIRALVAETASIGEVKNKDGRDQAHGGMMRLKNVRVGVEKKGKEAREDATSFSKAVIDEVKRLTALIEPEESRLQAARDAWDEQVRMEREAKEQAEKERSDVLRARVDDIRGRVSVIGSPSADIQAAIVALDGLIIDESFAEFVKVAQEAKDSTLATLDLAMNKALAHEAELARIVADRAELARLKAAQAKADEERAAAQAAEDARIAAEREANRKQIEEANRLAAEQRAEADRQAKAERDAAQAKADADQAERQRVIDEQNRKAEEARAAAQKVLDDQAAEVRRQQEALDAEKRAREEAERAERQRAEDASRDQQLAAEAAEQARTAAVRDAAEQMLAALQDVRQTQQFSKMPAGVRAAVDDAITAAQPISEEVQSVA